MATYQIENGSVQTADGITSFSITWTKDDGTVIGPHLHEVASTDEAEIYSALDKAATALENITIDETLPKLVTGKALVIGEEVAKITPNNSL